MPAISVGSVEVDVLPNATGVRRRMQQQLLPAADSVGDELGRVLGRYVTSHLARAVVQGVTRGGQQAQVQAGRQGAQTGSTFARSLKSRLEAAMASMPEIRLRADSSDAERELHQIRAQMQALRDVRIGIDVSEADAVAAMDRLRERLARLSASSANVAVRVDAGAAAAQLAAFQAEINRLDGQSVDIDVDTHAATANLGGLAAAVIALGPAILPVLPVIAAGLGAIAAAATAAAAGVGGIALVAVPAFKQMATVMQAQKAAQDAATNASFRGGQAASQAASRSLQQASAAQALATAERNGARQVAQAQAQVKQARQAAADAAAQAAQRNAEAARRVQDAERSLADAQTAAKQAQLDLTAARKQAGQELEDLNNRLADAQLSQRDAEIQLKEAAAQRDAVLKNAKSTDLDKQKALLAYDQAVQRLKEQTTETGRLKQETDAANKAGVKGTDTYKQAQDRLAQAQRGVADQQQAVKDAQAEAARTQVETAKQVAEAQQRVSEATANVAVAQQSAADAVASAQRQVASASLSAAGGVDQAAIAQGKYQQELAKLTPAARDTFDAFLDLKSAFGDWSKSLQPAVMPIFTRALVGLRDMLPTLTPFVTQAADAIKGLQDRASANLKKPFWQGFKKDLQQNVKPAITGLGVAFGNVITGMAGVIDAFLPHMDGISGHLQTITGRFADWGKGLKGSPEFERFLSYSSEHGPLIADTLGKIADAVLSIGSALTPVSGPLLQVIGALAQSVGWLATNAPELVVAIYGLFLATKLWALWQLAVNAAMTAFNLVMSLGPWGWIVLAIVGVALAIMELWKHCAWFRDAIKTAWDAIESAAQTVIDWFSGPFVDFFTKTIPNTFQTVIDWVKGHWPWILGALTGPIGLAVVGIIKHWDSIRQGISDAWGAIKKNTLYPIRDFFTKTIPGWADTLGTAVAGAFNVMSDDIKTAWDKIKGATKAPINFVIGTVWNDGIVKVWDKVTGWIPGVPELHELPKLAQGGMLPVQPGVFNRPTAIVGEGRPQHPEFVIPTDPRYRSRALALWEAAGGQLMADGGILGGLRSFGGKIGSVFSSATSFLKDPGKALTSLIGKLAKPLDKIKGTVWGKMAWSMPQLMLKGLKGLVSFGGGDSGGPIGGIIPTGHRLAILKQALAAAHVPPPGLMSQWLAGLNTLIQRESGWNPRAINRTDINARHGIPSQGLAQTIPPTWAHFVPKALRSRGILDPVANVSAAIRYIVSRYGTITNVQQANATLPPKGYDSGGWMPPGMNLMYNGLGQPEAVLTPSQFSDLHGAAVRGADSPQQPVVVELHTREGELGQFIDVRIQDHQQQLVQVLNAS
ncbi:transglycosylase SLT domain-containing protein [Streptomyces antimycoticus]|uniref:transglycosylase SLT domain-containing protein n=1 Tax=Streptomyces TaxID=1883 RepID=UPI0033DF683D